MKRSVFFKTIALGSIGMGLQTSFASVPFFQGTSVWHWLQHLRASLGVKQRSASKHAPENFLHQVAIQNDFLEKHGFNPANSHFYFLGKNESCSFYPAVQYQPGSGTTEMLLPVFVRNGEGVWNHQMTLNGFQLEALCRAADGLADHKETAFRLLMPVTGNANVQTPYQYQTLEGSVKITSKVALGKVQTRCRVFGSEGLLFDETFSSRHCLS